MTNVRGSSSKFYPDLMRAFEKRSDDELTRLMKQALETGAEIPDWTFEHRCPRML